MNDLSECPHCGSQEGFYRIIYIKGESEYHYNFPGTVIVPERDVVTNEHLHEALNYRENKTAFCIDCRKPIKELKEEGQTNESRRNK